MPLVIKADGLAAGKGVIITNSHNVAIETAKSMLVDNKFGSSGKKILIEEFLSGKEASFIAITDGNTIKPLATSRDYKQRDDNNKGPNTGGMGAYSEANNIDDVIKQKIMDTVMYPTIKTMAKNNTPYKGFLYAGLMIDGDNIKVLEFNCRLGDPETQVILMRYSGDFAELIDKTCENRLDEIKLNWSADKALCVVMSAKGYPNKYLTGEIIKGLPQDTATAKIFHSGTQVNEKNDIISAGGRVLCCSVLAESLELAHKECYSIVENINWQKAYYRKDIGVYDI